MYAFRPTVTGFPSTCAVVVMLPPEEATSIVLPDFDGRRATGVFDYKGRNTVLFRDGNIHNHLPLERNGCRAEINVSFDAHAERELYGLKLCECDIAPLWSAQAEITIAEEQPSVHVFLIRTLSDVPSTCAHRVEKLAHDLLLIAGNILCAIQRGKG
jgi:hypothetical protein